MHARNRHSRPVGPSGRPRSTIGTAATRALIAIAVRARVDSASAAVATLIRADLATRGADGGLELTAAGRAHLARLELARGGVVDPFIGQHLAIARADGRSKDGDHDLTVDASESPLAWLARRKGRDGRPLIEPEQLQAGERLRLDFTRAQMTPRVTSNWTSAVAQDRRSASTGYAFCEAVVAARTRVRRALASVGPDLAGLLLDVCCFLKGLEDIERERSWPPRSAKVVLQLALDRLARHYGYAAVARGAPHPAVRIWLAEDASFAVGE